MKLIKTLSEYQYKKIIEAAKAGELKVTVHSFKPGELKRIECFGVYADARGVPGVDSVNSRPWIGTFDSMEELLKEYPQAVRLT